MPPRASDLQSYIHRDRSAPHLISAPAPALQPQSQAHNPPKTQDQHQNAAQPRNSPSRTKSSRFAHPAAPPGSRKKLPRDDPFGTDVSGLLSDFEDGDVTVQPRRWPTIGVNAQLEASLQAQRARRDRDRFAESEIDLESTLDDGEQGHDDRDGGRAAGGNTNGEGIGIGNGAEAGPGAGMVLSWMKRTQEHDPEYAKFLEERRRASGGVNGTSFGNGASNGAGGMNGIAALQTTAKKSFKPVAQQSQNLNGREGALRAVSRSREMSPKAHGETGRERQTTNGVNGDSQHVNGVSQEADNVNQASDEQMEIDAIQAAPSTTAPAQLSEATNPPVPTKEYTPDYTPSQLSKMKFSSLHSQPFHSDPHSKPPQFPSELTSTASRLEHILHTSPKQANAFFASLPMENYAECGDLLVEKVAGMVARIVELRKEKRNVAKVCEDEVAKREERLQSEREKLGGELDRLKRAGENVVRGGDAEN